MTDKDQQEKQMLLGGICVAVTATATASTFFNIASIVNNVVEPLGGQALGYIFGGLVGGMAAVPVAVCCAIGAKKIYDGAPKILGYQKGKQTKPISRSIN